MGIKRVGFILCVVSNRIVFHGQRLILQIQPILEADLINLNALNEFSK